MTDIGGSPRYAPEELLAHADWARGLAAHLVRDPAGADDLVQDAFVVAMKKPPLADRPLRPWLAAVLRKLALTRRRGDARRAKRDTEAVEHTPTHAPATSEIASRLDAHRALSDVVAALPEPLRETVYLRYYEGLDSTQIARLQGVAPATVRWRLAKALEELRARLDERSGGRRAGWLALLVPIALPEPLPHASPWKPLAARAAALIPGVIAMGTLTKVLLGTGALLVAAALLVSSGVVELPANTRDATEPAAPPASSPGPSAESPARPPRRRSAIDAAQDISPEASPPKSPARAPGARFTVRARILDPRGAAASDAAMKWLGLDEVPRANADADGRVTLSVPFADGLERVSFAFSAVRCATRIVDSAPPAHGDALDLGDVALDAGGSVAGRVVDAAGAPIAGVTIGVANERDHATLVAPEPHALTDAEGRFVLEGLTLGRPGLGAGKAGFVYDQLVRVDVRSGARTDGVVIVLVSEDPTCFMRGSVSDPDGAPVPAAVISYGYEGPGGGNGSGTVTADDEGRFELQGPAGATWHVAARDPSRRWSPSAVLDGRSGGDVTLRLTPTRWIELAVTDAAGAPVERFGFEVRSAGGVPLDHAPEDARAGGIARALLPSQPFRMHVTAPRFSVATSGPLDPATVGPRVDFKLAALPGVRGRVTAGNEPVFGAVVSLYEVVEPGIRVSHNGFLCRTQPSAAVSARTLADGTYELTLRRAGRFVVAAESPEFARTEAGPFDLLPEAGRTGVDLVLTPGGSIEGRVLTGPERRAAGVIVGISRGDGDVRTTRTDADGAFRFEHLTAGPWLVRETDRDVAGSSSTTSSGGEAVFEWTCDVADGALTRCDLDLRPGATPVVRGVLRVDGRAAAGWTVQLGEAGAMEPASSATASESGTFMLTAPRPGAFVVRALSPRGLMVSVQVAAGAGETSVSLEFASGRVEILRATAGTLVWEDGAGSSALLEVPPAADGGTVHVPQFPAGAVRLVRPDRGITDPLRWPTIAEGTLVAGATLVLDASAK